MQYDLTSDEFNNLFLSRASKKNLFSTETDREHAIVFKSELPLTSLLQGNGLHQEITTSCLHQNFPKEVYK